mmetsp:Transcript_4039/g.11589  ORF Transcript_4039/g.11589 Transcript_4039/m.11589 type:complete len:240 (-) Transcript_4039:384-1103(-)
MLFWATKLTLPSSVSISLDPYLVNMTVSPAATSNSTSSPTLTTVPVRICSPTAAMLSPAAPVRITPPADFSTRGGGFTRTRSPSGDIFSTSRLACARTFLLLCAFDASRAEGGVIARIACIACIIFPDYNVRRRYFTFAREGSLLHHHVSFLHHVFHRLVIAQSVGRDPARAVPHHRQECLKRHQELQLGGIVKEVPCASTHGAPEARQHAPGKPLPPLVSAQPRIFPDQTDRQPPLEH